MKITRRDLYDAVWERPIVKIAEEFSTHSSAIVDACERMGVPRPTAGHWSRVSLGRPDARPELPAHTGVLEVDLLPRAPRTGVRRASTSKIAAPAHVVAPVAVHPLVDASRKVLEEAKVDERGILSPPASRRCLQVNVSPAQLPRALRVWERLLASLPAVNAEVDVRKGERVFETWLKVEGESFRATLEERVRVGEIPPTPEEKKRLYPWSARGTPTYTPTGELTFRLHGLDGTGARQNWADSASAKLDDKAADIAPALAAAAMVVKARREEAARKQREREEQQRIEEERRKEQQRQQALVDQMFQMRRQWAAAKELREFVQAVEAAVPEVDRDEAFLDWLDLARWYADQIDPLARPAAAVKEKLLNPDRSKWLSDEALGLKPSTPGYYGRGW